MTLDELLDAVKKRHGYESDNQLAKALGVSRQRVSTWRNGHRHPEPVTCATIAGLSGEPLGKVLGIVGEARAISREEKAVWRKLAATAALLAVVVFPALHSPAQAGTDGVSGAGNRHYANWRILCLWLRVKFGKPAGPFIEARL